jgi:hypothetical protein
LYNCRELGVEEKRLSEAQLALASVNGKLDLRTKQFAVLMSTIQNLKATLDEDVVMEDAEDQQVKRGENDGEYANGSADDDSYDG